MTSQVCLLPVEGIIRGSYLPVPYTSHQTGVSAHRVGGLLPRVPAVGVSNTKYSLHSTTINHFTGVAADWLVSLRGGRCSPSYFWVKKGDFRVLIEEIQIPDNAIIKFRDVSLINLLQLLLYFCYLNINIFNNIDSFNLLYFLVAEDLQMLSPEI